MLADTRVSCYTIRNLHGLLTEAEVHRLRTQHLLFDQ